MAAFLAPLAFSGLIAAQFLAVVAAFQYRNGLPASPDMPPLAITLIHRAA
jgi:hypothetical protein